MGTEEFLRQNIADLIQGKLEFSDGLPIFKDELIDITPKNQSEYDYYHWSRKCGYDSSCSS